MSTHEKVGNVDLVQSTYTYRQHDKQILLESLINERKSYDFIAMNETIDNVIAHLEIDKSVLNDPKYEFGYELKASITRLMIANNDELIIEIANKITNYIFNTLDRLDLDGHIIKYDYEDVKEFGNEVER